jgi:hypothetical protein
MDNDFPNQLRRQFPIEMVLQNPGLVMALYESERDHAADIIDKLRASLAHISKWHQTSAETPGQTINDIRDFARFALGEKK